MTDEPITDDSCRKKAVLSHACKLSSSEITTRINALIDVATNKSIASETREDAKKEATELVRILKRRKAHG